MAIMANRAVLAHRLFTGTSRRHLALLVEELAVPWQAGLEGRRHAPRGGARKRAVGAGARHQLVFVDRLVATLGPARGSAVEPEEAAVPTDGRARERYTRALAGPPVDHSTPYATDLSPGAPGDRSGKSSSTGQACRRRKRAPAADLARSERVERAPDRSRDDGQGAARAVRAASRKSACAAWYCPREAFASGSFPRPRQRS